MSDASFSELSARFGVRFIEPHPLKDGDLPKILELQNRLAPQNKRWTLEDAKQQLLDFGRNRGHNVRLLWIDGALTGVLGWVKGPAGEFFASPLIAADMDALTNLVRAALSEAIHADVDWIRVTSASHETLKEKVLPLLGFHRVFDFIEYELNPQIHQLVDFDIPISCSIVPYAEIDFSRYIALSNLTFEKTDNALALTEMEARELWDQSTCEHRISRVLKDENGNYIAFAVVTKSGYVDSIGVHPSVQQLGLAKWLFGEIVRDARAAGMNRIHTVVSSKNRASLRLHEALGFAAIDRRGVWQKSLKTPAGISS